MLASLCVCLFRHVFRLQIHSKTPILLHPEPLLHHLTPLPPPLVHRILTCNQNGVSMLLRGLYTFLSLCVCVCLQVWFQNRRSKERRMKQLSALGARRHAFFRSPRRMRTLVDRLEPGELIPNGPFSYYGGINTFLIYQIHGLIQKNKIIMKQVFSAWNIFLIHLDLILFSCCLYVFLFFIRTCHYFLFYSFWNKKKLFISINWGLNEAWIYFSSLFKGSAYHNRPVHFHLSELFSHKGHSFSTK